MTSTVNNSASDNEAQHSCFQKWMKLQQEDLLELIHNFSSSSSTGSRDLELKRVIEKSIEHFQDYVDSRRDLARSDVTAYLAPTWCTTLEGSMLWISGCRPSSYIRLIYAMSGKEFESHLSNYLQGNTSVHLNGISSLQMNSIDELQRKTIRLEDRLSNKLASLQEEIADQPFANIANEVGNLDEMCREAEEALDRHAKFLMNVVEEADQLRMETLKKLVMNILNPLQAVDFLIASKKLHLCINAWGKTRDHKHGRNRETAKVN